MIEKESGKGFYFKALDAMAEEGCLWLLMTGGEPLLHNDFKEIYLYAKNKGFLITIFTNATLMTPEFADFFKDYPPFRVEVTLYGASKEVYEKITAVSGSFESCINGIRMLRKRNIKLDLKTMVTSVNLGELCQIKNMAQDLGAGFRMDPLLHARLDRDRLPHNFRISTDKVVEIDEKEPSRRRAWLRSREASDKLNKVDMFLSCGAGVDSFNLDPYGKMGLCSMLPAYSFDLSKYGFKTIWEESFPEVLRKNYDRGSACRNCSVELYCAGCPGWSYIEAGNEDAPVEYLCEIAKKRKKVFDTMPAEKEGDHERQEETVPEAFN